MPERDRQRGELLVGVRAEERATKYRRGEWCRRARDWGRRSREIVRNGRLDSFEREGGCRAGEVTDEVDVATVRHVNGPQ